MVSWKLQKTMEAHDVTRYALHRQTGIAMNTLRAMYDGITRRPDLEKIDAVICGLRQLTGEQIELPDILEWQA